MKLCIEAEPLLKKIRTARKAGEFSSNGDDRDVYKAAQEAGIITAEDVEFLLDMDDKIMNIVNVDDFAPHELGTKAQPRPELVQNYDEGAAA